MDLLLLKHPGKCQTSAKERVLARDAPWTREQYETAQRIVQLYEPNMRLLDEALAAPNSQMLTVQGKEDSVVYLRPVRRTAFLLSATAAVKVQQGDCAGGFEFLVKSARMGNLVCRGGVFTHHLVGRAAGSIATSAATALVFQHDIPVDVLRHSAQEFLACADDVEPFVEALRAEAYMAIQSVDLYYSKLPLGSSKRSKLPFDQQLTRYPLLLQLMISYPNETRRNIRACYQHPVAAELSGSIAERTVHMTSLFGALFRTRSKAEILLLVRDPLGIAYANEALAGLGQAKSNSRAQDAQLRGTALFLAVMAYTKEHGHPPNDLKTLVPGYLPHLPIDPFSCKPYLYLPSGVPGLPKGTWAVYSTPGTTSLRHTWERIRKAMQRPG